MSYIDIMDYVRAGGGEIPQLLQVEHSGELYRLAVEHSTVRERHESDRSSIPREHSHGVYHIVLFAEGNSGFSFNGRKIRSRRGTLVLCSPGDSHSFGACEPGGHIYSELTFRLTGDGGDLDIPFNRLLGLYSGRELPALPVPAEILSAREVAGMAVIWERIVGGLLASTASGSFAAYRSVLDLLAEIIRLLWGDDLPRPEPLLRARAEIERRFADRLALGELAALSGMSKEHFCRAFKSEFGFSPIAWQRRLRIGAAENLLRTTSLRCKEIAARVGFGDEYQFSKAFRKIAGESPGSIRGRSQSAK